MSTPTGGLFIRVHGTPAPQGSKRHVGKGILVESSKRVKPWRQDVKYAALEVITDLWTVGRCKQELWGRPVRVSIGFLLPRPKGHHRTGANAHLLRASAPAWPAVKPDVDKLLRSTLDALGEAGVWADDAQVVDVHTWKAYAPTGETPGAVITVEPMGDPE